MLFVPTDPLLQPLASRLRPEKLTDFVGQAHFARRGETTQKSLAAGNTAFHDFMGPPGTVKQRWPV